MREGGKKQQSKFDFEDCVGLLFPLDMTRKKETVRRLQVGHIRYEALVL